MAASNTTPEDSDPKEEEDKINSSETEHLYKSKLANQVEMGDRKHGSSVTSDNESNENVPSVVTRGQARFQQLLQYLSYARKMEGKSPNFKPVRSRIPPKFIHVPAIKFSQPKSHSSTSLYYIKPQKPQKVISWYEAYNSRPSLRFDMDGPGPCTYSPRSKSILETSAPLYSFSCKNKSKKTGRSRAPWIESRFQSSHPWHIMADYSREKTLPSPNTYPSAPALGPNQSTMIEAPSYTFGHRRQLSFIKPDAHKEPSPNEYDRQKADDLILSHGPSFTHHFRRGGTLLWNVVEPNPGPAAYDPILMPKIQKPAYTIQGIRREKSYVLGPYCSL